MKFRGLVLATAAAMTASLFSIPVSAEDTAKQIIINEIDIRNFIETTMVGEKPTYTANASIVAAHSDEIKFSSSPYREYWQEVASADSTGYLAVNDSTNAKWPKETGSTENAPTFDTFEEGKLYRHGLIVSFTLLDGYTAKTKVEVGNVMVNGAVVNGISAYVTSSEDPAAGTTTYYVTVTNKNVHPAVAQIPMFRMYNPNSGEHFYTKEEAEKANLVSVGWNYESIGWIAPSISNTPVYRVYNPNAGDHHYTMSYAEKEMLVGLGWNDEGIGWYSDDNQAVRLYREYNPNAKAGSHNYTTDQNENDSLVKAGWQYEGTAWYALKAK